MQLQTSQLEQTYTPDELHELERYTCSKTIQDTPEIVLPADLFCQPIDIAINLPGNQTCDIKNMHHYPLRSLQNTIEHIHKLLAIGITTIMIRMDAPASIGDRTAIIERQGEVVRTLREEFGSNIHIIVDPFSIALNPDGTWGALTNSKLNYIKTMELFADITTCFASADADYLMTLGRFEREVDVTSRTIRRLHADMHISSFSTNTETTNAYVYKDQGAYMVTKQKILVSNYYEMTFRALVDIYEGSQLIVIKPAENLHVLERIKTILQHPTLLTEFLTSKPVNAMVRKSTYLHQVRNDILSDPNKFADTAKKVGLATYTVSGTYFIDTQTLARKGNEFLASLLYERYANIASTLSDYAGKKFIIDRNAYTFLKNRINS